ncbi:MAG: C4-dicarboxylate ABC transporter substrate-binding protein [Hyphomicrobiales bacterium]|nr:C4-dicarboxylate ABC transporter substrate-binding protein [Hyphomicrobiales bacterium]MCP4999329.1 C4-dicarboxylate ABC transporter substrate-binding protein [Hyphomicrobiales bacterium]
MSRYTAIVGLVTALAMTSGAYAQTNLSAETGPPTGAVGASILTLAEVAAFEGVANIQVATGQTLTNSVQNVAEGKTDIAAAPFILPFLMSRGAGPYAALGDQGKELASKIAVLYTYRIAAFPIFAYESGNFNGWQDVAGKTIYNGPPRGAALNRARAVIKLATGLEDGNGYQGLQVNWGQAVKTITDGSAAANVLPVNFPDARMSQAAAAGNIKVWSFPKDIFEGEATQKYMKAPGTVAVEFPITPDLFGPGISVVSEDDTFRAPGEVGGDVVSVDMDFELAKALTAAFLKNIDVYKNKTPYMSNVFLGETDTALTSLCGPMPIKYHPGAVAAWEEAGYTLPDCAKP